MNKFLRIIATFVVGVGLILLFVYLSFQCSMDKAQMLEQPSYYTLQNYWYLLVSGCGCVAFSILSCFLAWNKGMDEKVEILPNAVAAEKAELLGWLSGSSLDTKLQGKSQSESGRKVAGEAETAPPQKRPAVSGATEADTLPSARNSQAGDEETVLSEATLPNSGETIWANGGGAALDRDRTVIDGEQKG